MVCILCFVSVSIPWHRKSEYLTLSEKSDIWNFGILVKGCPVSKHSEPTVLRKRQKIDVIATAGRSRFLRCEETSPTTHEDINSRAERVSDTNFLEGNIGLKVAVIDVRSIRRRSSLFKTVLELSGWAHEKYQRT